MTRGLVLMVLGCLSLRAQFDEMVTTDDGSTVLFRSPWRLAGSNDTAQAKIFRWDAKGFSLVFSPPDSELVIPPYADAPFLTGDGGISGYAVYPGCSEPTCFNVKPTLMLNGATVPAALPSIGPFQISRNGRFLAAGGTIVDLSTGAMQTSQAVVTAVGGRFGIGNNGGLLMLTFFPFPRGALASLTLSNKPGLRIASQNEPGPFIAAAVISAAENRVVYEALGSSSGLWACNVDTGQSTKLEDRNLWSSRESLFQPSISNDGSRVLYRRFSRSAKTWEAVVHDFNTASATVIAQILPSADNLVISGDGNSAWVHRVDGRLVQIAIDGLRSTMAPGTHAWMTQQDGAPVPGSFNHVYGEGFAPKDTPVPPSGLSLTLTGLSFPILGANVGELDVQIPWEAPASGQFPLILHNSLSPFESLLTLEMQGLKPTFERTGTPYALTQRSIKVFHQDFRGLVTEADPAQPGEYVHAYMTGLGSVNYPHPATGWPTAGLSYASVWSLCWLASADLMAQKFAPVTFAGLAPGIIGMYQVDIEIPQDFPTSTAALSCVDQSFTSGELIGDSGMTFIGTR